MNRFVFLFLFASCLSSTDCQDASPFSDTFEAILSDVVPPLPTVVNGDPEELEAYTLAVTGNRSFSYSADVISGMQYRKISLDGSGISDAPPEAKAETDQHSEESYIDALTLQLRHDTSDIYIPLPGNELTLQVRRSIRSDIWGDTPGLRPEDWLDHPFGMGWTTSLTPHIRVETNSDNFALTPLTFYTFDQAQVVHVTDENGQSYRFNVVYENFDDTEWPNLKPSFIPATSNRTDLEGYLNKLEILNPDDQTQDWEFQLTRKFGTKVIFSKPSLHKSYDVGSNKRYIHYARAREVRDRYDNTLVFEPRDDSLVPVKIVAKSKGGEPREIAISTNENGLISKVVDPMGNEILYNYLEEIVRNPPVFQSELLNDATENAESVFRLDSVIREEGVTIQYGYDSDVLFDDSPKSPLVGDGSGMTIQFFRHYNVNSITDGNGNTFSVSLNRNESIHAHTLAPWGGQHPKRGIPKIVSSVEFPDGSNSSFSFLGVLMFGLDLSLDETGNTKITPSIMPDREVLVIDTEGGRKNYRWKTGSIIPANELSTMFLPTWNNLNFSYFCRLQEMEVQHMQNNQTISETVKYFPESGMPVKSVTDQFGHTTNYSYNDSWNVNPQFFLLPDDLYFSGKYADPSSTTNATGAKKEFDYIGNGLNGSGRIMAKITDELGRITQYEVDPQTGNRLSETVSFEGAVQRQILFEYDDARHPAFLTRRTIVNGTTGGDLVTAYEADQYGNTIRTVAGGTGETGHAGRLESLSTYDLNGNKLSETNSLGQITSFTYDKLNRLVRITLPPVGINTAIKSILYDNAGNQIAETNENGITTRYTYDSRNRVISQTLEMEEGMDDLVTFFTYNKRSSRISVIDPRGIETRNVVDELQRVVSTTVAHGTGRALTTLLEYGENSGSPLIRPNFKPTKIIKPSGLMLKTIYDSLYRPVSISEEFEDGVFATSLTSYDKVGNPVSVTDPLGKVTETTFDALNRPVQIELPDQRLLKSFYTSADLIWKTINESGFETEVEFDAVGRPLLSVGPDPITGKRGANSPVTHTVYDVVGRIDHVIDPLQRARHFEYDERGRKVLDKFPPVLLSDGSVVRPEVWTAYDNVGNVISVTDPAGHTSATVYDNASRPLMVTDALGNTTISEYDPGGNIIKVTDANGNVTVNEYNALNQLTRTIDPEGGEVNNEYDNDGNLSAVIDGNGSRTQFTYDGLKRLQNTTHPDGSVESIIYDAVNKVSHTDENGNTTSFDEYDNRHRLLKVTFPDGNIRTLTYDDLGNILTVTESLHGGKTNCAYSYDALNRVLTETAHGILHRFSYDLVGNRIQTIVGHTDRTISAEYDSRGKLTLLTENGRSTAYHYDIRGNQVERSFSNGQKVICTYDGLNRLTTRTATANGNPLQSFSYTYDKAGNVTVMEEDYAMAGFPNRSVELDYDKNYRLVGEDIALGDGPVTSTRYTYDAASNRTGKLVFGGVRPSSTSAQFNSLNQLTSFTDDVTGLTATFEYDLNGNRIKRTASDGQVTNYSYDPLNRLIGVSEVGKVRKIKIIGPNDAKGHATFTSNGIYSYNYDYRTRRISRTENTVKTDILFLGGTSIMEFEGIGDDPPDRAPGSTPTVEYIRGSDLGGGIGGILYSLRGGQPAFTWYNNRGDVVAKTDNTGTLTWQAAYEAFGSRTQEKGETKDRQRANTREETPWGGLYENMRWRDLETGTYLTRDPAGFVDGPNLYAYVRQNPWSAFDPHGLATADDHIEWQHGIPKKSRSAELAKQAGVNVHDKKWGSYMEKQDHRLIKGEGLHTKGSSGTKRTWDQAWDTWADGLKKAPTEKDFETQFEKLKGHKDFSSQYDRSAPADMDYADKNGKSKKGTWTSSTPLDSSAKQTHAKSVMAAHGKAKANALNKAKGSKTKAAIAGGASSLFLMALSEAQGANEQPANDVKHFMKRVQLSTQEPGHVFTDMQIINTVDNVRTLFGNEPAAIKLWGTLQDNLNE
ncbi:MAG: hypothetical protein P1V20_13245 [Verrucomicrobiales bacterium]|nr:hypothetical protein [Verrucomicrobiales bacterium]